MRALDAFLDGLEEGARILFYWLGAVAFAKYIWGF